MSRNHLVTGQTGEREAIRFLKKNKYKILARNYTCPLGELDIVAICDEVIIFVEVKTRRGADDHPEDAVNHQKRRKLTKIAQYFISEKRLERFACRFDIVAVHYGPSGRPQIEHYPDAFSAA